METGNPRREKEVCLCREREHPVHGIKRECIPDCHRKCNAGAYVF